MKELRAARVKKLEAMGKGKKGGKAQASSG